LDEAETLNAQLAERLESLQNILEHTLAIDDTINFESLRIQDTLHPFEPPRHLREPSPKPILSDYIRNIKAPTGISSLIPGAKKRYEEDLDAAKSKYHAQFSRWESDEKQRQADLIAAHKAYKESEVRLKHKQDQRNEEVEEFRKAYEAADPDAIVAYNNMVLERSEYPSDFPQEFRLAYTPESKQLVVEYQLPCVDVVPRVTQYRYVQSRDEFAEKQCKPTEIRELYKDVIAAVALRTIHEVLEADQRLHIDVVVFNGFLQTVDRATGQDIRPHLISVRSTRQQFEELNLARVDKQTCLRNLGAQVSPSPAEAIAVKPVVEFNMVDKRFVEQSDVLADLESRPNLMELNPFEFEHLVANLFEQLGLESKLTRSSRDGGVDCVAFDPRPVLGGKVIIQAKRYRNTVGVSAVRDLYGTMQHEGANKGILVTTSGYGQDAYQFSKDKPIELIDGGGLLYLLQQIGVEARIIFPAEPSGT